MTEEAVEEEGDPRFEDLPPEKEKEIRDIGYAKEKITEQRGRKARTPEVESKWVSWAKRKPRMTVDEFINKIFEGEQDFSGIVLKGRTPDLTEHHLFEHLNEYLRLRVENSYPGRFYLDIMDSDFSRLIARGAYLPLNAANADLSGADFTDTVMPNLYFDVDTIITKAKFVGAVLSGVARETSWAKADISGAGGELEIVEDKIELILFDRCDIRKIIGLDKSHFSYEAFIDAKVNKAEADILEQDLARMKHYTVAKK
jgi:hypothetical protein